MGVTSYIRWLCLTEMDEDGACEHGSCALHSYSGEIDKRLGNAYQACAQKGVCCSCHASHRAQSARVM